MGSLEFTCDSRTKRLIMTEAPNSTGANLRLARQARGFSQQQLASMAGVSRQAVSAVESGHSDPSLRVALALAQALGLTVEELFGPGEPAMPVTAVSVTPLRGKTDRLALAPAAPAAVAGPKGDGDDDVLEQVAVRPIGPPRPTLVVAGCDPALPLLGPPLALLDPPVAFAWWPCGSATALRLARQGLVHAAGVHTQGDGAEAGQPIPDGANVVGFTAWREGFAVRPSLKAVITGLDTIARHRLRIVNREPGAEARRLLD